jgi:pyruvate dehydrogenase E1 component beta subunit
MAEMNMIEAIRAALSRALEEDPDVIIFGEDVGIDGGVFRATDGLVQRYGSSRVRDTPLSETLIAGMAIGAAAHGLRPVAEIQFMGFLYPALDQLANHASRLRNRTRGRLTCPMVLRAPYGGGIHAPEHHSESTEAMLAHIPEPKRLYRAVTGTVDDNGEALPLDKAFVLREGGDVTLVTWGAMVTEATEAATQLAETGVSIELIDLATLKPLDRATLRASVEKTGRCVIVHEAPLTAGLGAEIAADLAEHCLTSLLAPIRRVTGYDTVMPYPRLEAQYMPNVGRILDAAYGVLEFA